jgi:hypothetical protein
VANILSENPVLCNLDGKMVLARLALMKSFCEAFYKKRLFKRLNHFLILTFSWISNTIDKEFPRMELR